MAEPTLLREHDQKEPSTLLIARSMSARNNENMIASVENANE
jgi:hypothetical protein